MATMVQSLRMPAGGPSWDEEVVPALRKRLESESRTLAKRMSAISLSSQDGSSPPNFSILSSTTLHQISAPTTPYIQSSAGASHSHFVPQEFSSYDRTVPSSSRSNGSAPAAPKRKTPSPGPSSLQQRSRTYSQPYIPDIPGAKPPPTPRSWVNQNGKHSAPDHPSRQPASRPSDHKPTRIPKASRINNYNQPSPSIPNGYHYTSPDTFDLHVVPEAISSNSSRSNLALPNHLNPGLLNEVPPFHPGSNTSHPSSLHDPHKDPDEPPPRNSTDSEERPFEHWYRGEVSRNGGVGELRVGRRQEMLDIANYGHTIRAKMLANRAAVAASNDDGWKGKRRKRAGSVSRVEEKVRQRESIFLNDEDARRIGNVLDEDPLTDLEDDLASVSDHHTATSSHQPHSLNHYTNFNTSLPQTYPMTNGPEDISTASAPPPRTSYDTRSRSTTPTSLMQRPSSRLTNGPPTRIPGPGSRRSSESRGACATPTQTSRGPSSESTAPTTVTMSSTSTSAPSPPPAPTPPPGQRSRQPSKPPPASAAAKRAASPSSSTPSTPKKTTKVPPKATRSKTAPTKKELENEAYRRSVVAYPAPVGGDELMHAIPSWTQPVRAGNWDDVVLPVVARKRGLDDQYEMADGKPVPKKVDETVAPAPGTFGFRYRQQRSDDDPIEMDEFGQPLPPLEQQQQQQPSEQSSTLPTETAEPKPELEPSRPKPPANSHDETRVPVQRPPQPSSPAPFADYAPSAEKIVISPGGTRRPTEDHEVMVEEDGGAGCCKCVVM